jgi:transcriptional regulator with XRE-family HTH domain
MPIRELAGRLRSLREAAGLSVQELAEAAGLDRAQLWRIEKGKQGAAWETIVKLAEALEISTEAFQES